MKKIAMFAVILRALTIFAFAETPAAAGTPHASPGDLIVNAGVLYGWYGFGVGGGAEYIFARLDIPRFAPLTFGGAVKASIGYPIFTVDCAALATMHFGLRTFAGLPAFLRGFDWYWGLGLAACGGTWYGFGPSAASGISFYLNPRLAVNADIFVPYYLGLGVGYSGILGVKLKL